MFKTYLKKDLFYPVIMTVAIVIYISPPMGIDMVIHKVPGLMYKSKDATVYSSYTYFQVLSKALANPLVIPVDIYVNTNTG